MLVCLSAVLSPLVALFELNKLESYLFSRRRRTYKIVGRQLFAVRSSAAFTAGQKQCEAKHQPVFVFIWLFDVDLVRLGCRIVLRLNYRTPHFKLYSLQSENRSPGMERVLE